MRRLLLGLLLIALGGCSVLGDGYIHYPHRSRADWNPELASEEVQRDLAAGKPKLYVVGGLAPQIPGVGMLGDRRDSPLPLAAVGPLGCIQTDDPELFDMKAEYALRYNQEMLKRYVPEAQTHAPATAESSSR